MGLIPILHGHASTASFCEVARRAASGLSRRLPPAEELENAFADPGDAARLVEVWRQIASGSDRQQELVELDGLEVVKAEAVGRRRDESPVVGMGTVDADGLESLLSRRLAMTIEPQFVGTLAVESDAAAFADQLKPDVHLAAVRHPARLDVADRAAGEADEQAGPVLVVDGTGRLSGDPGPTLGVAGLDKAVERLDRSAKPPGDREDVPAEVAERPAPPGEARVEPP